MTRQTPEPRTETEAPTPDAPTPDALALDDLAVELRIAVMRTSRVLRTQASSDAVTAGQNTVLGIIAKRGPQTMRQLADAERVQAPSMTRTVNALAAQGLVTRTDSPTDGRQVVVDLTREGRAVLEESRRLRSVWLASRLEDLSDADRATMHRAAEILVEMCAR
ncbi:MarR family transcriptional regulator [Sinomonas sp. ASV322]|uniref:MarR family winged helix-turn-helix transcriptional regulator n=1 Tax=Sinomonas sp. ASV322 TaxID=3041920 RepID=UPI0027DE3BA9|nr:MarR family transcriptional regulator [Sinomonas sp. ASV322]MDQ4501435.1 MarR family transcriptional regulator [Sinomonas sp. ASV322]